MKKLITLFFIFGSFELLARPEYALQIQTNRCTTCHSNPAGGGHRNLVGKAFGPKSAPLEAFSQQDLFGFDFRSIAYSPAQKADRESGRSGLAVMAAIPSISVPFNKAKGKEWRLDYAHNVGGFPGASYRSAYLSVKLYDDYRLYPQYVLVGRFTAPFGLLDDEHRTYIRQLTKSSWNDKEMGILFSGDWSHVWHYDLALVNGEQTAGAGFASNRISQWGGLVNMRALFANLGWMLGVSASYYNKDKKSYALSVYQNLSMDTLTKNWLAGNLTAEAVFARQMNSRMALSFFSEPEYRKQILESDSIGYKAQWNYNFLSDWKFIFKFDHLALNTKYLGSYYQRYGFGLRHFFNNQVSGQVRYEKAFASHGSEQDPKTRGLGAQDAIWALLQVKI